MQESFCQKRHELCSSDSDSDDDGGVSLADASE